MQPCCKSTNNVVACREKQAPGFGHGRRIGARKRWYWSCVPCARARIRRGSRVWQAGRCVRRRRGPAVPSLKIGGLPGGTTQHASCLHGVTDTLFPDSFISVGSELLLRRPHPIGSVVRRSSFARLSPATSQVF
jgi:hypothetical protein